jgi:hypothetical protein
MASQALALASLLCLPVLLIGSLGADALTAPGLPAAGAEPILAAPHADPIPVGVPTLAEVRAATPAFVVENSFVCASPGQAHHQLIFARPYDTLDDSAALSPLMLEHFAAASAILYAEGLQGLQSIRYRVACAANGAPSVNVVTLPTPSSADSFATITADLADAGYDNADTKYIVWYDDPVPCGCSGLGERYVDDRPSSSNYNNHGAMYGATFIQNSPDVLAAAYHVMLHESGHTMGAVQDSAPHSNRAGHCNDGLDVMCYYDATAPSRGYRANACPASPANADLGLEFFVGRYDCNRDDYFNPDPQNPNYLCSHWNIGARTNRFLQFDLPVLPPTGPVGEGCT